MSTSDVEALRFQKRLDPIGRLPTRGTVDAVPDAAHDAAVSILAEKYDAGEFAGASRRTVAASALYTAGVALRGKRVTQDAVADAVGTTTLGIREWMPVMARALLDEVDGAQYVEDVETDLGCVQERLAHLAGEGSVPDLPC